MSMTQFTMVNELASLVKDNLPCKHLVLSMEEAFVNFLQDESCSDGILELEPTNPYNRLLLHRLADIFGFSHESIGEGDDRHLILERNLDTSIPSILVSDILCHYDEDQFLTRSQPPLRREESPDSTRKSPSLQYTIEERQTTDLAAGKRIFAVHVQDMQQSIKQRPQHDPVVAQRMIAHALGKNINRRDHKSYGPQVIDSHVRDGKENGSESSSKRHQDTFSLDAQTQNVYSEAKSSESKEGSASASISRSVKNKNGNNKANLKEEHMGAAKRMFAHALGLQPTKNAFHPEHEN